VSMAIRDALIEAAARHAKARLGVCSLVEWISAGSVARGGRGGVGRSRAGVRLLV
jgi:hypothetical protein